MELAAEAFEDLRPLLFSIAYRMLGSVAEAEDIVQEAFLRYHRALAERERRDRLAEGVPLGGHDPPRDRPPPLGPRRKESYVGAWLPEPLLTDDDAPDAARHAEDADSLSMAFLLCSSGSRPVERAVFLLHDVFDYGYDEVAAIVGKNEDNCRQLAVARPPPRRCAQAALRGLAATSARNSPTRFFDAVGEGDMDGLVELLAADVVVYGDGGGTSPSWRNPIFGRDRVLRLLLGLGRHWREYGITMRRTEVNGQPGAMFLDPDGKLMYVMTVDIADDSCRPCARSSIPTSCVTSVRWPTSARCSAGSGGDRFKTAL